MKTFNDFVDEIKSHSRLTKTIMVSRFFNRIGISVKGSTILTDKQCDLAWENYFKEPYPYKTEMEEVKFILNKNEYIVQGNNFLVNENEAIEQINEPIVGDNEPAVSEPEKSMSDNDLESEYNKTTNELLLEIKKVNNVLHEEKMIFEGKYSRAKSKKNNLFWMSNVNYEGNILEYPKGLGKIDNLFLKSTPEINKKVKEGQRYYFTLELASLEERKEYHNPYRLNVNWRDVQDIKHDADIIEKYKKDIDHLKQKWADAEIKLAAEWNAKNAELQKKYEEDVESESQKIENLKQEWADAEIRLDAKWNAKNTELQVLNYQIKSLQNQWFSNTDKTLSEVLKEDICQKLGFGILKINEDKNTSHIECLDFETDFGKDYAKLSVHIQHYLYYKKKLIYTEFQIKNFLALLMTNDLIVLSGLSGSGKTQIVKSFAEALGGVAKIIPVKPNWTSSEDLLGYYNPLQSAFLATPFTEAITEARQNPNKIYLICLDEMNLARVEYYFADFLSKMEERKATPTVELYAQHEEEIFISEFLTLLPLFKLAIGDEHITNWEDCLQNENINTRLNKFLGNSGKESLSSIYNKIKRRLVEILKFPATLEIPNNIRFIGAINVDETTHYFSPKILDRVHIVKFENPLLFEGEVKEHINEQEEKYFKPVNILPIDLMLREPYPEISSNQSALEILKDINKKYLLPLNIDFGIRSLSQSINYIKQFNLVFSMPEMDILGVNIIIIQKILPRFVFDGQIQAKVKDKEKKNKIELLKEFKAFLEDKLKNLTELNLKPYDMGLLASDYLDAMIIFAENNNNQVTFYS